MGMSKKNRIKAQKVIFFKCQLWRYRIVFGPNKDIIIITVSPHFFVQNTNRQLLKMTRNRREESDER
jgi:hypothetical protein